MQSGAITFFEGKFRGDGFEVGLGVRIGDLNSWRGTRKRCAVGGYLVCGSGDWDTEETFSL